ncbi:MAG: ribonuclease HII [Deltaproteobacteria bacterium]|nr:ribonuclease HII [Deltaproteobacteria bacterium]
MSSDPSRAEFAAARPLAVLRAELAACRDDAALEALAATLATDARAGARELLARIEARRRAAQAEHARLAKLLALRDALARDGARGIAGVDEVGVGPLAGPVVAAAVVLPGLVDLPGLDDSKRVAPARREQLDRAIRASALGIGLGVVPVEEIDQLGIYRAALEAMRRAVASLARIHVVDHLLVDARTVPGIDVPQTSIIKGDQKDASIAAASIVAKVHRDALMVRLAERHPAYGFERHMGYGTAEHVAALERFGPCPAHRRSFAPVAQAERRFTHRPGAFV